MNNRIEEEKKYLENVKSCILKERENAIESIKNIPHEYKGRYSQVKWGDEDLVKDLTNMYTRRLATIQGLEKNPYFGSFDFAPTDNIVQRYRIGKTSILENRNLIVLDWRNPICSLYYDHSNGDASYKAPCGIINGTLSKKSQIRIQNGVLEDVVDVDLVSDDELLRPYLDVKADNRMKTIIASIQTEQNNIIRDDMNQNLIIQGVAGSGKTSVALHRIAYLLYSLGEEFDSSKFGIIGPNKYFLNYISKVLPDLDTQGIKELTFEEICSFALNDNKYSFETLNDELNKYILSKSNKTYNLKGTLEYKNIIDNYLKSIWDSALTGGISIEGYTVISEQRLKKIFNIGKSNIESVNSKIKSIVSEIKSNFEDIYYPLTRPIIEEMKNYPSGSEKRQFLIEKMDRIKEAIKKGCAKEIKEKLKPLVLNPIQLYKLFLKHLDDISNFSPDKKENYITNSYNMISKKIIPCEDRAAILYLSILQNNTVSETKLKHIVIDEAQDYSIFEYKVLKSLFSDATFSIFGDLAQSIYPNRKLHSWNDVRDIIFKGNANIKLMNKSYRTTKQITEESNYVLDKMGLDNAVPIIRNGIVKYTQTQGYNLSNLYLDIISSAKEKGYSSIGIICKDEKEMKIVSNELSKLGISFNVIESKDTEYNGGINVLTSYLTKGLEFDSVIINDASNLKYHTEEDMRLLYVAMTRALHDLNIFYSNELTEILNKENHKVLVKN